ncbi:hypothetical protein EV292_103199 [Sphingomonas sp. BK235]|nr:hypothetical protein EV292_103199 [Sphingomonas sp. BK235]
MRSDNCPPLALILAPATERDRIAGALAQIGWHAAAPVAGAALRPEVILCAVDEGGRAAATLRAGAIELAQVPVVALASAEWIAATDWRGAGYDAAVDRAASPAALADALGAWRRDETLATLDRLEATFGSHAFGDLLRSFRRLLERVRDDRDDAAIAALAHRVAGIAGTLGFAALGQWWLRFSEGEVELAGTARRAAAHAIATLDRRG